MKNISIWLSVLVALVALPVEASKFVRETTLPLEKVFIPHGFDSNDSIEVVVAGSFPSSCYKMGPVETMVNAEQTVEISVVAYEFTGKCIKGPIPFFHVVPLGRLREPGTYRIVDAMSKNTLGKLNVAKAADLGHGTDEVLYVPLTDAYLVQTTGRQFIRFTGAFSDSCMTFKKVLTRVVGDVLIVLPQLAYEGENCEQGHYPFTKDFDVKDELPHENFLMHVRTISGSAINKMIVSHP